MNLKHLGDALDFWKGGIFRLLGNALNDVHVLPMFTDMNVHDTWTDDRIRAYAILLGVDQTRILRSKDQFPGAQRERYFHNLGIRDDKDIFVDPDIGIEPNGGGDRRHIRMAEIEVLLPRGSSRVLLVYQHSYRNSKWVDKCLDKVCNSDKFHAFAYCAGTVAMIFVARRENQHLKEMRKPFHITRFRLTEVHRFLKSRDI